MVSQISLHSQFTSMLPSHCTDIRDTVWRQWQRMRSQVKHIRDVPRSETQSPLCRCKDKTTTDIIMAMQTLSIQLPNELAKASQEVAHNLGMSRSEFIRRAIIHEIQNMRAQMELDAMVKSFVAMKKHSEYLEELEEMDTGFDDGSIPPMRSQLLVWYWSF